MLDIRTVLCPIDFSPLSERTIDLAISLCRWFNARIVLQHNVDSNPPDFLSVNWMWSEDHEIGNTEWASEAAGHLRALLEGLPPELRGEAKLTRGPLHRSILEVADRASADLIVLGCHDSVEEGHRSLAERIISTAPCTVLTINEHCDPLTLLRPKACDPDQGPCVLVPLDLHAGSRSALALVEALDLQPHEVHVLHVVDEPIEDPDSQAFATRDRILAIMPPRLRDEAFIDVRFGEPGEQILRMATEHKPVFIIMPAHRKGLLTKFLLHDRAVEILHQSCCPVWFVPPRPSLRRSLLANN